MIQKNLTYDEIVSLISFFEKSSEFNRINLRYLDLELELEKKGPHSSEINKFGNENPDIQSKKNKYTNPSIRTGPNHHEVNMQNSDTFSCSNSSHEEFEQMGWKKIASPMVGTFYAAPEPGAEPFVKVGQMVDEHTQVCIIEVMKLMSSIEAGVRGIVKEILVQNNEAVEFGQILFWIQPDI